MWPSVSGFFHLARYFPRFTCVTKYTTASFLLRVFAYTNTQFTHIQFLEVLSCFCFLTFMNNAAMNIPLYKLSCEYFPNAGMDLGMKLLVMWYFYVLWGTAKLFSTMIYHSIFSPAMYCFNFSTPLPKFINACFLMIVIVVGMKWLSNCSSDLHFPNDK